jgi:hypothetical protein
VVIGLGLLGAIIGNNTTNTPASTPAPTQEQQDAKRAADAAEEMRFQRVVLGAKQLRDSMRNPDSFKLSEALMMKDGAVCYEYRAQNGFGGMNLGQQCSLQKESSRVVSQTVLIPCGTRNAQTN